MIDLYSLHHLIRYSSIIEDESDLTETDGVMALEIWHHFGQLPICSDVIPAFTAASEHHQSRFHIQHFPTRF